jgi:hypothetical protein
LERTGTRASDVFEHLSFPARRIDRKTLFMFQPAYFDRALGAAIQQLDQPLVDSIHLNSPVTDIQSLVSNPTLGLVLNF